MFWGPRQSPHLGVSVRASLQAQPPNGWGAQQPCRGWFPRSQCLQSLHGPQVRASRDSVQEEVRNLNPSPISSPIKWRCCHPTPRASFELVVLGQLQTPCAQFPGRSCPWGLFR